MLVLAAPACEDPRDGGYVHTLPGELLTRPPVVCDAGRHGHCGCERSWAGITSRKATTLAHVVERALAPGDYIDAITDYLTEVWDWERLDAAQEATFLATLAGDYQPGTLLTIDVEDDRHVFTPWEA